MILTVLKDYKLSCSHNNINAGMNIPRIYINSYYKNNIELLIYFENEESNWIEATYNGMQKDYSYFIMPNKSLFSKAGNYNITLKINNQYLTTSIKVNASLINTQGMDRYSMERANEINKVLEQNSNEISSISSDLTNSNNMLTEDLNAFKSSTNASNEQISNTLIELQNTINELNSKIAKLEENQTILEENEKLLLEEIESLK